MSDIVIKTGILNGIILNSKQLLGALSNLILTDERNEKFNIYIHNDNFFEGNINDKQATGKLKGNYSSDTSIYNKSGSFTADCDLTIQNVVDKNLSRILNQLNNEMDPYSISMDERNKLYITDGENQPTEIEFDNNLYERVINEAGTILTIVKDAVYYDITLTKRPTGEEYKQNVYYYKNSIEVYVTGVLRNIKFVSDYKPDTELYNIVNNEMNSIYNSLVKNNYPPTKTVKEPINNLFTPYTIFADKSLIHLNNEYGVRMGVIKNVNPNIDSASGYYRIFNNNANNSSHGDRSGNAFVINDKPYDINNKIYNYEKYHQYILKIDISNKTNTEIETIIREYSKSYLLDVLMEDGRVYGVYITGNKHGTNSGSNFKLYSNSI